MMSEAGVTCNLVVYNSLIDACGKAGFPPIEDEPLEGYARAYLSDPFGNRIEVLEPIARPTDGHT